MTPDNKKYEMEGDLEWRDYYDILNDRSNNLNENERAYLSDLLRDGDLYNFRDYYRKLIKKKKMNQNNKEEVFFGSEQNEALNNLRQEQKKYRELADSYAKRLADIG
ncbi:hypothetical protein OFN38_00010 [Escherichia coli]|nr:hypothetical protein [Escherichia coli]